MLDWLWPIACLGCGEVGGSAWCADCAPGSVLRPPSRVFGVEWVFSIERYDRPVGDTLRRAKLSGDPVLARGLAALYARCLAPALVGARFDAVVPAPSSRRSRLVRGFSMAALLARALSAKLRVPRIHALRSTARSRLATLDREQRQRTLRGAIRSTRLVPGRVLLVDDVLTTGATAEACAVELLGGASSEVVLATLCAVPTRPSVKRVHL